MGFRGHVGYRRGHRPGLVVPRYCEGATASNHAAQRNREFLAVSTVRHGFKFNERRKRALREARAVGEKPRRGEELHEALANVRHGLTDPTPRTDWFGLLRLPKTEHEKVVERSAKTVI
jgi:hypothetical protein